MPKLPDMEVTAEQWERLLPVFNSDPAVYRRWLAACLIREVIEYEVRQMSSEYERNVRDKQSELLSLLQGLESPPGA